jgi:hypothetical protein
MQWSLSDRRSAMPLHDWTRVEAGVFHALHTVWVGSIQNTLNEGLLPEGFYALAEQHTGFGITDVLTLHGGLGATQTLPLPPETGSTAVAEAPPRTRRRHTVQGSFLARRRSLAIRHVSGHRLVALIEIVSPANKDRPLHVENFARKAVDALDAGVHVLLADLFPPGPHDPGGMHGVIVQRLEDSDDVYEVPPDEPATLASYAAGSTIEIEIEHVAVGAPLPEMPLFLRPDRYINVPLESTYQAAYHGMPAFWRNVLEGGG